MNDVKGVAAVLLLVTVLARAHLSGIAYPFVQGFLLIPAIVALALLLLAPVDGNGPGRIWGERALLLPWIWCLWSFAGIIWSVDQGRGLDVSVSVLLNVTVFTLVYILRPAERPGRRIWVTGLWILLISVVLRGAYQYFVGLDRLRHLLREMAAGGQNVGNLMGIISRNRIFAGFLNSNMLAGFLAVFIPVTLDLTLTSKARKVQLAWGSLLAIQFWILLLTGSVGGTLAAATASVAVLLIRRGVRRRDLLWMGSAAVVILVGLIMIRGVGFTSGSDNSVIQRIGYMKSGILMALERPVFGWGPGSGPSALMAFVPEGIRPVTDPHNFLIRSWISWGIPGLAILVTFLLFWARKVLFPLIKKGPDGVPAGYTGFALGGLAFLLHSLMDMDFFVPETALFGWAALGICLASTGDVQNKEPDQPVGSGTPGLKVLGAVALALVLPALVYTQAEFTAFRAARDMEAGLAIQSADRFGEAVRLLPFNGRFILEEGRSLKAAGQFEEAAALFEGASELIPYSPYPSWEMGRIALVQKDWEGAVVYLEMALTRYPTSPRIRLDLAHAHYEMGQYEETLSLLQEVEKYSIFDREARTVARKALEGPNGRTVQKPVQPD